MVDRTFLKEQVIILLKFAKIVSDPKVSAALVEKAIELKDRVDQTVELMPDQDRSPRAPDVEAYDP